MWISYLRRDAQTVDTLMMLNLYGCAVDAYVSSLEGEIGKAWFRGLLESSSGAGDCWVSQLVEERHELILYFKMLWSRIKGMFDIWTLNHLSNRSMLLDMGETQSDDPF